MNRFHSAFLLTVATLPAQWTPRAPATTPPARSDAGMVYDLVHGHTVLFGGAAQPGGLRNDTWTWDGSAWQQRSPAHAPTGRFGMGMTYDIGRGVVVLHGGMASMMSIAQPSNETWEWDGVDWTRVTTATTAPRLVGMAMAYDLFRGRTVLYGGSSNPGMLITSNQTWEYDGVDWMQRSTASNPGALEHPGMFHDARNSRMVLFGGINPQTGGTSATWSYDGVDWRQIDVTSTSPPPRACASMVYDLVRQVGILQGGVEPASGVPSDDTWEFDGTDWTQVRLPQPPSRMRQAMAFDLVRGRVVLHGGVTAAGAGLNDTHEFGAAYELLGSGCAGSNGVPVLSSNSVPRLGSTFVATLGNLAAGAQVAAVVAGLSATDSPLGPLPVDLATVGMPGCALRVSAEVVVFLPVVDGVMTSSLAVPASASFLGFQLHQQGLSLDAGANAAGLVASNAMTATVGH